MGAAPAYTTVPGKVPDLLARIRETGVPSKVNREWLKSLGLVKSNDSSLINVLKQVGFVDASNSPTPAWRQFRGGDHQQVLARAVKQGYADLYATFPNAHEKDAIDLAHWFSTKSDAGKQVIDKSVATFKALVSQADFGEPGVVPASQGTGGNEHLPAAPSSEDPPPPAATVRRQVVGAGGTTININVQLTLPETTDEGVYEAFFRAMREHLLADDA